MSLYKKNKKFIFLLTILVILIVLAFTLVNLLSKNNLETYTTSVFSFKYPHGLVTADIFNDTPNELYNGLIQDSLVFYLSEEEIAAVKDCRNQEQIEYQKWKDEQNSEEFENDEFYSQCPDKFVLITHIAIHPEGERTGLDREKENGLYYESYEDRMNRAWTILETGRSLSNLPFSESETISYHSSSILKLDTGYIQIDITTQAHMLEKYLANPINYKSTPDDYGLVEVNSEHKKIVRSILDSFELQ